MTQKQTAARPTLLRRTTATPLATPPIGAVNLGLIGIRSGHGYYLQSHDNGELHASNPHRNEEETWFLMQVDEAEHLYGLYNWANGKYLSKRANGCVWAVESVLSLSETWVFVSGRQFGIANAIAIQSAADSTFIGANDAGQDIQQCGGEVAAFDTRGPNPDPHWPGWWIPEAASAPEPGSDVWNTVGSVFTDILVNVAPVAIDALLTTLIA